MRPNVISKLGYTRGRTRPVHGAVRWLQYGIDGKGRDTVVGVVWSDL